MKNFFVTFLALVTAITCAAQEKKPMSWQDIGKWRYMPTNSFTISPDGQWTAYAIVSAEGDGELVLQKNGDTAKPKKYPIGNSTFPSVQFSKNSQWIAFIVYPNFSEKKANEKSKGKPLQNKLTLIRLSDYDKHSFSNAGRFAFNGEASTLLAVDLVKEGSNGAKGSDLLLYNLASGKNQNIGNVSGFSFNKSGEYLAYSIDAANQSGNGIYLMKTSNNSTQVIDSDEAAYQSINWTEKGDAFAALKLVKDKKYKQDHGKIVGVTNLASPVITLYDPQKDSTGFPQWYTISSNRTPTWSEDLTRIFYGISLLQPAEKATAKTVINKDSARAADDARLAGILKDTSIHSIADLQKAIAETEVKKDKDKKDDATKPDMTIWHWKDARLQSSQQVQSRQDDNYSFYGMYTLATKQHKRLNDSSMLSFSLLPKDHYALASDRKQYELEQNLNGQNYMDIYLINLQDGSSKPLFTNFYLPNYASYPRSSPDGTKLIYAKDGQFYVFDITTSTHKNITGSLPVSFVNTEDDHNVEKPMYGSLGWSSDSKYVWLNDGWDIWQVAADGKTAVNLTEKGRQQKIRYTGRYALDPEEKGIDLNSPQYLRMYGEWTKKSGIALLHNGKKGITAGPEILVWEDADLGDLQKAKDAPVYFYSKEDNNQPPEIYRADNSLKNAKKVTANAPDFDKYNWSAGTRLVNYVSDKGDTLQGALYLPAGYEAGKQYPTVVYYYEKTSQTMHNWSNPSFPRTGWNPGMYTSNGYAVFMPDIVYKLDDPGMSAVWCVLPAVKAAIATGVVDKQSIGIHGHSWGGYQTAFLITQTNMFKAAAAGAPLTNMISMYDLIYWNSGGGNMSIFEASQGRFRGAPWTNWDAYERNSPVYHVNKVNTPLLLLHNDKDGAVDFTQGVEYYNALRRLQKPVVMIQYKGENHGLAKVENMKDYGVRMMEFFDHYLKGKPAPAWLTDGINHKDLQEHLEERAY